MTVKKNQTITVKTASGDEMVFEIKSVGKCWITYSREYKNTYRNMKTLRDSFDAFLDRAVNENRLVSVAA